MAVRQSPCETQVLPTVLFLLVAQVRVRALPRILSHTTKCNNAHRPLPIHNQPQSNKEVAHPQAMSPLQEISRIRQDMVQPPMAHLLKVVHQ